MRLLSWAESAMDKRLFCLGRDFCCTGLTNAQGQVAGKISAHALELSRHKARALIV
jgi:hypothetical protein